MKTEKIIKELKDIKEFNDVTRIDNLIEELENDLQLKCCLKTTKRTKINAIKRILSAKTLLSRPKLMKYDIQNEKTVFTDSYQAYRIDNLENNPFERATENDNYPKLDNCFPKNYSTDNEIKLNYNEIKANKKIDKDYLYIINDRYKMNPNFIINAIEIMPDDTRYFLQTNGVVYGVSDRTGDDCILLPIRVY